MLLLGLVLGIDVSQSIRFVENVAAESGGGIFTERSSSSSFRRTSFVGNVAAFGGGLAVKDSTKTELRTCSKYKKVVVASYFRLQILREMSLLRAVGFMFFRSMVSSRNTA